MPILDRLFDCGSKAQTQPQPQPKAQTDPNLQILDKAIADIADAEATDCHKISKPKPPDPLCACMS